MTSSPSSAGLVLFKRHCASCTAPRTPGVSAEAQQRYWACPCPIWIKGYMPNGEVIPRHTTGVNSLAEAEALRDTTWDSIVLEQLSKTADHLHRYLESIPQARRGRCAKAAAMSCLLGALCPICSAESR